MIRGPGTQDRHTAPPRSGVPTADCHDHIFPREWHRVTPALVFLRFLVPGEGPQSHEILHHATVIDLVLDGVHMVWAGLLNKSLDVVCQRPHLGLASTCGSSEALHVGATHFFLVIVVVVGHGHNPLRVPLFASSCRPCYLGQQRWMAPLCCCWGSIPYRLRQGIVLLDPHWWCVGW
jgi:hypothetical protein